MRPQHPAVAVLLVAAAAAAQGPVPVPSTMSTIPGGANALCVPIHTAPDDAVLGPYGTWAMGRDYKVSFHDGFAFYPRPGPDTDECLPFRWRTQSIRAGDTELPIGAPTAEYTDWRFEYRYAGFVEAYDVRPDGVEQSFRIEVDPGVPGDLVVVGVVVTRLRADAISPRPGAILFGTTRDTPAMRYDAAIAFDAVGRRTDVHTSFDGDAIRLTVPGAWLAGATFPITIDPLVSTAALQVGNGIALPSRPEMMIVRQGTQENLIVVHTRAWSATDWDCFADVYDASFGGARRIYADVSTSWSTYDCAVAFVGATQRWVVVHDRQGIAPTTGTAIRVYLHDFGNPTPGSGPSVTFGTAAGELRHVDVGGTLDRSRSGDNALVVFESKPEFGPNVEVFAAKVNTVDPANPTYYTCAPDPVGQVLERRNPTVNQFSAGGNAAWVVVWEERVLAGGFWNLRGRHFRNDGTRYGAGTFGPSLPGVHVIRPRVSGVGGRYLLSCTAGTAGTGDFGESVYTQRFDWPDGAPAPTHLHLRRIAHAPGSNTYKNSELAYDFVGRSHWALAWQRYADGSSQAEIARVGYTGGVVEWLVLGFSQNPVLTFDAANPAFPLVWVSWHPFTLSVLLGDRLIYDPGAVAQPYGAACGDQIVAPVPPDAGHEFFEVVLLTSPSQLAALFVATATAAIPLDFIGMQGCVMHVNPLFTVPVTTNALGEAGIPMRLPDFPPFFGDLYFQWVHQSTATSLGLATTSGLQVNVR